MVSRPLDFDVNLNQTQMNAVVPKTVAPSNMLFPFKKSFGSYCFLKSHSCNGFPSVSANIDILDTTHLGEEQSKGILALWKSQWFGKLVTKVPCSQVSGAVTGRQI